MNRELVTKYARPIWAAGIVGALAVASPTWADEGVVENVDITAKVGNQTAIAVWDATALNSASSIAGFDRVENVRLNTQVRNQTAIAGHNAYAANFAGSIHARALPTPHGEDDNVSGGEVSNVDLRVRAGNQTAVALWDSTAINAAGSIVGFDRVSNVQINTTVGNQTAIAGHTAYAGNFAGSVVSRSLSTGRGQ